MLDLIGNWKRTKYCGNVGTEDVGNEVILMGWVQLPIKSNISYL